MVKAKRPTNVFVSHFAADGKSGSSVLYHSRNANNLPPHLTGSMDDAVAFLARVPNSVLILVDDMIGTGQTILNGLRTLNDKLKAAGEKVKPVAVYAAALVGFRSGVEAVKSEAPLECKVLVSRELDETYRAFSPNSDRFRSATDRVEAERLCRSIGEVLEPKQPLGFGEGCGCHYFRASRSTFKGFASKYWAWCDDLLNSKSRCRIARTGFE